jgi:hypothetical protein
MPQLDFVGFHYVINTLSFSYLFVYVCVMLFFLKPIFNEIYLFYTYPTVLILSAMLLRPLYAEKVIFTALPKQTPCFWAMKNRTTLQWDWYKYMPRKARYKYVADAS